ncbi:hypothetical protein caldi_19210 [Caldinitratiruptor microaerophilus]|uniref:Uncharacterized protein n=1 Tax=Caldinitratiruptor microaerophilus TaxID=671077 RepID=A0AA35G891_9FIRM|nr:hypothetical protein caldi_19210 [Caldinitratiruptor microaerophilus]
MRLGGGLWYNARCQTSPNPAGKGVVPLTPAQVFWDLFLRTGSVIAYLLYKRFTLQ